MQSKEEEKKAPSTRVVMGGVSTGSCNYNRQETLISIQDEYFKLSSGELANLKSLEAYQTEATAKPLIQRVPSILGGKKDFQKYFKPKVIAIGPLHHDDPSLQEAEKLKLKLAAHFVKHIGAQKKEILYNMIKEDIANLKKCYDPTEIQPYFDDEEKLTWMFFLDGCAVLQAIYLRHADDTDEDTLNKRYAPDDTKEDTSNELNIKNDLLTFVYLDMFLLENQLPYSVLELLCTGNHGEKFKKAIERFIDENVMTPAEMRKEQQQQQQQQQGEQQKQQKQQEGEPAHLLELLRSRLVRKKRVKRSPCRSFLCPWVFKYIETRYRQKRSYHSHTFRNVKELREAGIWLRPSETSCLEDVSFNRVCCVGKLRLPPIIVDDSTGPKFMNLIAYEMCPNFDNDFAVTSYICFLDSLIDEAEDVKELRDAGILYNGLGSDEEVAKLFNKMNTDLVPSEKIYSAVKMQIQSHCRNIWIIYAAQAYHTHFRSPWTFLAFVGAIAALLLSALQTYYTIHPK